VNVLESRWDDVGGVKLYARSGGEGSPVVLLHGYGLSGRYMLPLARILASSCSVFVPDLPGHGRSERSAAPLGITSLADALGDWLDVAGLERPAFVANSMGCQIVTELAVRRPEQVGAMVLVGPTIDPGRRSARHQIFGALRDSAHEPALLVALAGREWAGSLGQLATLARSVLADRIEERLPSIEQPTIVVHGEKDGLVSREWAEQAAELLLRGRLVVVPDEPHAIPYTHPQLLAGIVQELIAEEAEHTARQLPRSLPHRDVPAGQPHQPRPRQQPLPLLRNLLGNQPVAVPPDE
jgi:2-hydroxy-6-oxonona-2,4-dienedioate hydrolase